MPCTPFQFLLKICTTYYSEIISLALSRHSFYARKIKYEFLIDSFDFCGSLWSFPFLIGSWIPTKIRNYNLWSAPVCSLALNSWVFRNIFLQLKPFQQGKILMARDALKMYFGRIPPQNQFLGRAYLVQAQLLAPESSENIEQLEKAVVFLLRAIKFAKENPRCCNSVPYTF